MGLAGKQVIGVIEPHLEGLRPRDRRQLHLGKEEAGRNRGGVRGGGVRRDEESAGEEKGSETNAHIPGNEAPALRFGIDPEFKELRGSSEFAFKRLRRWRYCRLLTP